jgi:acetoin utilization protein AcuB
MSRPVITIEPKQNVGTANRLLTRHRIRQLPVVRGDHLVGIVSQRDVIAAPASRSIASVMTAKPITVAPEAAIDEAARLLRTYKISGLPVLEQKHLIGIITAADVLDALIALSGVTEATYRLILSGRDGDGMSTRARRAVEGSGGELKWLHRDPRRRPRQLQMRVKTKRIDSVVNALESAGFEIVRAVPAPRRG